MLTTIFCDNVLWKYQFREEIILGENDDKQISKVINYLMIMPLFEINKMKRLLTTC